MDTTANATNESVKNLILLNNDRHQGYEKATSQAEDSDLKHIFSELAAQSKKYSAELEVYAPVHEEAPDSDETTNSGKLYRVWMDVKNALGKNDRKSVLSACEYGEDVIKKAYEKVLEDRDEIDTAALHVIQRQYDVLLNAHNRIKAMRNSLK